MGNVDTEEMDWGSELRQILVSSIKGEVKKKHHSNGWSFSCFAAHRMKQDLF